MTGRNRDEQAKTDRFICCITDDLCVFSPSIHLSFPHKDYTRGEANIYELANFDELDGLIMDSALSEADERMYRYKVKNRRHRSV